MRCITLSNGYATIITLPSDVNLCVVSVCVNPKLCG